jgi:fibronectin-binding autotransporter adhesin
MATNRRVFPPLDGFMANSCRALGSLLGSAVLAALMLLLPAPPAAAQDTWQGTTGKWSVASNWTKGVPTGTTPIIINSGIVEGDTSFTNRQVFTIGAVGQYSIDSTIAVTNTGTEAAINNAGGFTNFGTLINENSATITNTGLLQNLGQITNSSQFNNNGSIETATGSFIINTGTINSLGTLDNMGELDNSGSAMLNGFLNQSTGTIHNSASGQILGASVGAILNNGTIINDANAGILIETDFDNAGTINNAGSFANPTTLVTAPLLSNLGTINNSGTFNANQMTNTGNVNNTGTMTIGQLILNSGVVNNTAGTMQLQVGPTTNINLIMNSAGAQLDFDQTALTNSGQITNAGTVIGAGATILNTSTGQISNTGAFTVVSLENQGSVMNNGTMTILGTGFSISLGLINDAGATFTNNGALYALLNNGFSTNGVTNQGTLINTGTVSVAILENDGALSNLAGSFQINPTGAVFGPAPGFVNATNAGTITNAAGAEFTLISSNLDNSGTVNNSGMFTGDVNSSFINDSTGTLNNSGTFAAILDNKDGGVVNNTGTMNLLESSNELGGTINNNAGTLQLESSNRNLGNFNNAAGASVIVTTSSTFENGNIIVNTGTFTNNGTLQNASGGNFENFGTLNNNLTLENLAGSKILTTGTINNAGGLENSGTLQVGVGIFAGTLNNTGTINNTSGGFIDVTGGGTFNNSGNLISDAQSNFSSEANSKIVNTGNMTFTGNTVPIGGAFRNDGTVNLNPGPVTFATLQVTNTGTLSGTGTINGNVFMQGTMAPGDSTGLFTINGSLTDTSSASFLEDIMGTGPGQNGELKVTGDVTLAGALDVDLLNSFVPQSDGSWVLLQYDGTLTGMFSGEVFPSDGLDWSVVYDTADHEVLLDVTGVEGGGGGTNVPEPSTGALLLCAVAVMFACSRLRKRAPTQGA